MSTWNYDPMGEATRAERERQVARFQLEREARKVGGQGTGTSTQNRRHSSLRHRLAVVCRLAQGESSAPIV